MLPDGQERAVNIVTRRERRDEHQVQEPAPAVADQARAGDDHGQRGQKHPADNQEGDARARPAQFVGMEHQDYEKE